MANVCLGCYEVGPAKLTGGTPLGDTLGYVVLLLIGLAVSLFVMIIGIPLVILSAVMLSRRKPKFLACSKCGSTALLPADSEKGMQVRHEIAQQRAARLKPPPG